LKKRGKLKVVNITAVLAFFVFAFVLINEILNNYSAISEKQEELDKRNATIAELKIENEEYRRVIASGDYDSYAENRAVEEYDYGYPNELRFYDTNK
jgi:cell division protein FtsB